MSADEPLILNLAGAVLDGDTLDWTTIEADASDSQRAMFAELRAVSAISSLCRRPPTLPAPTSHASADPPATWAELRVLEPVGRGGFGTVFRAWDPQLDREVALKLLPADEDGAGALAEGRLLARVHHPNVVTIFGADREGAWVGLWMEFVRGATLDRVVAREGALSPARVAGLGRQLCGALAAVHDAGLVHRDVKAHNVMLEPGGRLVLMDFGAGRLLSGGKQDVAGTPLYLAPEIFAGGAATEQSDIYSVGVLLYYLLTGRHPIEGRTLREVREAHLRMAASPDVRLARPDVPRRLATAIGRALAPLPAERFQSAGEMAGALAAEWPLRARAIQTAAVAAVVVGAIVAAGRARGLRGAPSRPGDLSPGGGAQTLYSGEPTARRLSLPDAALAGGPSRNSRYFSYLDDDGDLAVCEMATGRTEKLVAPDGDQFAEFSIMSPDGGLVAYQWWTDRRSYEVRIVDRLTKAVRVLVRDDSLDNPLPVEWARDGSSILLWMTDLGGSRRIALADPASGALRTVREVSGGTPLGLSLSPDGRHVAYDFPVAPDAQARVLHVVDTEDGADRVLFADANANDRFPLWTPDGRRLFFISDRSGSTDGWLAPIDDGAAAGGPALVVRNLGRVSALGLTDAGTFYYRLRAGAFEVQEIALEAGSSRLLPPPRTVAVRFTASNIGPSYSADGRQLAYISVRDGLGASPNRVIVIKDLETGVERELTPERGIGNAPARWSPDGRTLLAGSRILDAQTGLVLHEFNTHAEKDQSSFGPTRWAADGRSVVYEHEDKGLVRHPLDGGPEVIVYPYSAESQVQGIHRFEISPDGQALVFSASLRDGSGTVLQVVIAGRTLELERRAFPEGLVVQGWSRDSQQVFFTTFSMGSPAPHEVWRVPVWGDTPQRLGFIDGATQINPMAFSPSGSVLAYTTGTPLQELWMMEHFLPR